MKEFRRRFHLSMGYRCSDIYFSVFDENPRRWL